MTKKNTAPASVSIGDFPADLQFLRAIGAAARLAVRRERSRSTIIGTGDHHLAERVHLRRDRDANVYVHFWRNSDPDELHDHPWDFVSLVLTVGYWEITPHGREWRPPGSVIFRKAEQRHRIELETDRSYTAGAKPVTLVITGPVRREWGFHTPKGFVVGRVYRARGRKK